ncbi:RagB/SusD family nutrient uptake outer membrane protein [Chitinophaga sp. 30R24]|uniref:RagB/SusD family nutrient uptake outer membrane protein n=1 Tax=Chitinophaga sp. 30R24 TaxID=3248838 RepID=UPI003B90AF34
MKKFKFIIAIAFAGATLAACNKLDVKPLNIIGEADIFTNETGVTAYLANIYKALPIEDFFYRPNESGFNRDWQQFYHSGAICGELVGPFGSTGEAATGFGYWPYDNIRNVNTFLSMMPKYASKFDKAKYNGWLGEAYFCRAYFYFSLVKRYGGVPIIKYPQAFDAAKDELLVHRDKEVDVWNFIASDLDSAALLMPETSPRARANKYVAEALKSRAMLYAGTIAKYGAANYVAGDARDQGLAGIPADAANGFFQQAYDAAKAVEGHYDLYKKKMDDKVKNFTDLFLDQSSNESIFVRDYSLTTNTAHSWDATMTCRYMTADGLSRAYPTLEFVERFAGPLPVVNPDGTPRRFNDVADLMQGLEPRLLATIYFPGATLRGLTFDTRRGIYDQFTGTAADEVSMNPPNAPYRHLAAKTDVLINGMSVIGNAGMSTNDDNFTRTGFYVRKYIDYNKPQEDCGLYKSTTSWIDLRYAEVLLNRAEAAMELGNTADAVDDINLIRDRAGATLASGNITIDTVRNERCKELAFEKQYWWDLKRWRTADKVLDNTKYHALMPYYVMSEKKYIFLKEVEPFQRSYTFEKKFYYEPLPGGELGKNANLYPNNPNY